MEKFPTTPQTPEQSPKPNQERPLPTQEEMSEYASWAEAIEAKEGKTDQESPEACAEKIAELETLFADFEQSHDLEALRAITHFNSRAERIASIRQPALDSLPPIIALLNILKDNPAVPEETYNALKARAWVLENAIGFIQGDPNGKVYDVVSHDRVHVYK